MRKRKGLAFGVLVLPLPLLVYVVWRYWVGSEPHFLLLWLTAVVLITAGVALMWLMRRKSLYALIASLIYFGVTFGSCALALWHGERKARIACEDGIQNPLGEHAEALRELASSERVTCSVSDFVSGSWFMMVRSAELDIGSMWLVVDENDELLLRRVTVERGTAPSS